MYITVAGNNAFLQLRPNGQTFFHTVVGHGVVVRLQVLPPQTRDATEWLEGCYVHHFGVNVGP